jgi:hypothetical protein
MRSAFTWFSIMSRKGPAIASFPAGGKLAEDVVSPATLGWRTKMLTENFATDGFRYIVAPLLAALFQCGIKCFISRVKEERISLETFSFWLELTIVSFFNLLATAAEVAVEDLKSPDKHSEVYGYFLWSIGFGAIIGIILMLLAYTAARARKGTVRRIFWQWIWPHAVSVVVLVSIYFWASIKPGQ